MSHPKLVVVFVVTLLFYANADEARNAVFNGERAYREWLGLKDSEPKDAFLKLVQAATLGNASACKDLAFCFWPKDFDYSHFGKTEPEARVALLEKAPQDDLRIAWNLGKRYRSGPKEIENPKKARAAFRRASEGFHSMAWQEYGEMCANGEGGKVDLISAYFYLSAACASVHPDSVLGKSAWEAREAVFAKLTPSQRKETLKKLDHWFSQHGGPKPLLSPPAISPESHTDTIDLIAKREAAHRRKVAQE